MKRQRGTEGDGAETEMKTVHRRGEQGDAADAEQRCHTTGTSKIHTHEILTPARFQSAARAFKT